MSRFQVIIYHLEKTSLRYLQQEFWVTVAVCNKFGEDIMTSVTVPALNNLLLFQAVMQGENVSEIKRVLIETVSQMRGRRWNWKYFSSNCRAIKFEAESNLLAALNTSCSMHEIAQALCNYKRRLDYVRHKIHPEGNTSAFIKAIDSLVSQSSSIPASICTDVRTAMKKAGYFPCEEGMCYGIAWTALLACVRQDGQTYMQRMQYLKYMNMPPSCRADVHQVYPFFDAVILSMTNYIELDGYEKGIGYPGRQEVAFPGRVIGGHEKDYHVPVVKHTFIAECTPETFIRFLQQTRKNNNGIPFGMMIHYPGHATSIGFDGNKWLAADHDNHYYTADVPYTFLGEQSNYHNDGKMITVVEVVTGNGKSLNINNDALVVSVKKSVSVPQVLHLALRHDDMNITNECITIIGQQTHTAKTLFNQLSYKERGIPGFFMALQYGYADSITAFILGSAAVIAALPLLEGLKAELLYDLLASKRANGTPGFFMALHYGHTEAVRAFIQASAAVIARLSLSKTEKAKLLYELLTSKKADGTPGFFMTLQYGYPETITVFIQESAAVIARLSLSKTEKAKLLYELLTSKDSDGTPGFFMALLYGHIDTITAFIQSSATAMAMLSRSEKERGELLYGLFDSMANDNKPKFLAAMKYGGPAVNKAFTEGVDQLPLSVRQKEALKHLLPPVLAPRTKRPPDYTCRII